MARLAQSLILLLVLTGLARAQERVVVYGPTHPGCFLVKNASGLYVCVTFLNNSQITFSPYLAQGASVGGFMLQSTGNGNGQKISNLGAGTASGDAFVVGLNTINQTAAPTADFSMNGNGLTAVRQVAWNATHFASLGAAVNGTRRYCDDCDPPANPPTTCTSAGAKTGAYADGLNGAWVCAP